MIRLPPRSSRSYPPFPYPTLLRSIPLSCSREESAALAELLPGRRHAEVGRVRQQGAAERHDLDALLQQVGLRRRPRGSMGILERSEEHTSELQSLMRISYAVFCLKKKKKYNSTRRSGINNRRKK